MIDATQKKLREARFFLQHLVLESQRLTLDEPEAFGYFLSAFLSAARSVTFAIQNEEKQKYDDWFPTWFDNLSESDSSLMNFLKTQRNVEQKQGGAEVDLEWQFVPITDLPLNSRGRRKHGLSWFGAPGTPPPRIGLPRHYFNLCGDKPEVLKACERYVTLLIKLVEDFLISYAETKSS